MTAAFLSPQEKVFIKHLEPKLSVYNLSNRNLIQTIEKLPTQFKEVYKESYSPHNRFTFSLDGTYMVTAVGGTIFIWETETGNLLKKLIHNDQAEYDIEFLVRSNNTMSSFDKKLKTLKIWSLKEFELLKEYAVGNSWASSVSPDGTYYVQVSADRKKIKIETTSNQQEVGFITIEGIITSLIFNTANQIIVNYRYGKEEKTAIFSVDGTNIFGRSFLERIKFTWDNKYLLHWNKNNIVRVYSIAKQRDTHLLLHHKDCRILWGTVAPYSNLFISYCDPEMFFIWSISDGKLLGTFKNTLSLRTYMYEYDVNVINFSQDGTRMGYRSSQKEFTIVDLLGENNRELLENSSYLEKLVLTYYYKRLITLADLSKTKLHADETKTLYELLEDTLISHLSLQNT